MTEQQFAYSQFPARWGPSIVAALLVVISLTTGHLAIGHNSAPVALAFALVSLGVVGYAAGHLAKSATFPGYRARSVSTNLVAIRGGVRERPRVWLVAHIDSKSQTIPMLVRVGSVVAFAILFAALLGALVAMSVLSLRADAKAAEVGHTLAHLAFPLSMVAALVAMPIVLCFVGNRSSGAVDNASGVAAVLIAAESVGASVGVLVTSAEELGLAGARAFADAEPAGVAINCDTVDDDGRFIFMAKGSRPPRLAAALDRAVRRSETAKHVGDDGTRIRPMLPGVLADNVAFTDAGWESLTVSRGNLATLARVHTARDRAEFIEGTGIAQAARLLAATVEELS